MSEEVKRTSLVDPLALETIDDDPLPSFASHPVPTMDQDKPVAAYLDWRKEDTRIVTYAIGNHIYPGEFAESRDQARALCEAKHGRILEANYMLGRAFFRVRKVRP